jgi:hypothetical protein
MKMIIKYYKCFLSVWSQTEGDVKSESCENTGSSCYVTNESLLPVLPKFLTCENNLPMGICPL